MRDEIVDTGEGNESSDHPFAESVTSSQRPLGSFSEFDGYAEQKAKLHRTVVVPSTYGRYSTSSVLLVGEHEEAETGRLAKALTGEFGSAYSFILVESVVGGFGDDETSVTAALQAARQNDPAVVVLDCLDEYGFDDAEFDALRHHVRETRTSPARVLVVATSTQDGVANDESLFEVTVSVPEPGPQFRRDVLRTEVEHAVEAGILADSTARKLQYDVIETHNLSCRELRTAVKRAVQRRLGDVDGQQPIELRATEIQSAVERITDEKLPSTVTNHIFGGGSEEDEQFEPEIPDVSFADIGGLQDEKRRVREAVTIPFKYRDTFQEAGFSAGQGVLLHGPPGTGKTMLAKAVANELDHHFLSVKGPEIERALVGESERQLRELFQTARSHEPSVVFFDEFDALAPSRDADTHTVKRDLVNTLLSELDGLEPLEEIVVLAATNRVESLDDAVLRSGRFDTFVEVSMPDSTEQKEIFRRHVADIPTANTVTAEWFVGQDIAGFSGADTAAACRKALEFAASRADETDNRSLTVTRDDVSRAIATFSTESSGRESFPEFQ